ncbi:uncharacterized protein Z518_00840 [Rhinocladiella mackenziei CBS 650.93]|uniref:Uncharacterized protein n=1 Tax=Rhinocladiella mackenziei CBS 650.93 TaxID=1442369 RepID=A0A0D2IUJ9_9EURO|nr:uncharacterized protein Z518_00840 [Rhinocladiella mackenziei CBS 650.93]KIX09759.1 hypothetical protein Z518_00840 [Rhinocladiella mackenziei CBS 650.93]
MRSAIIRSRQIIPSPGGRPSQPNLASRLYATTSTNSEGTSGCYDKRLAQESRDRIDRQSDETAKSGTDDVVANQTTISFDPSQSLDPEQAREAAKNANIWSNPLDTSPANRKISEGTAEIESGVRKKETIHDSERGTYRSETTAKKGEAGFEKRAFAGSSKSVKQKERPPMIRPGAR